MNYFLRTLEGIGDVTSGVVNTFVSVYVPRYIEKNLIDRHFLAFKDFVNDYPGMVYKSLVNDIIKYVRGLEGQWGQTGWAKLADNMAVWYANYLRKQKESDPEAYTAAMKKREEALIVQAEQEEAAAAAARLEELQEEAEREEAAAAAAAAVEQYEQTKDEIASQIEYIENGLVILTTPEQVQIYEEMTGKKYGEGISSGEIMDENLDFSNVPVYSETEKNFLWEDENSITWQDERGEIHTDPKAKEDNGIMWIAIAAAAVALL